MKDVRTGVLAMLASILTNTATARAAETRAAERLLAESRPLVIGHRGFPVAAPENTLPSFQLAILAGADFVELDYHHSRDGIPIVLHDEELDRTTDADERWHAAKIQVGSRAAQELLTLDAGSWFSPQFAGTRLPLLTEALDLIQTQAVTLIERKAGDAGACVQLLRQRDLVNRVVVQAFDWTYLRDFHRLEPRQILGALGPPGSVQGRKLTDEEKALDRQWVDQIKNVGARIVVWNRQVSRPTIAYAHQQGLKVWVYTINEAALANALLDQGVDGLISDNAALIWRVLALRGLARSAAAGGGGLTGLSTPHPP